MQRVHAGPRRFAAARTPAHAGGPRAAKMGTKICYQGSWASQIASHEWVLKFVIKVVGQDYQVVISWAFLPPPSKVLNSQWKNSFKNIKVKKVKKSQKKSKTPSMKIHRRSPLAVVSVPC